MKINLTRRRKIVLVTTCVILIVGMISVWVVEVSRKPALIWKVAGIESRQIYSVQGRVDYDCLGVYLEVSNTTPKEVIVDWNRDETSFQISGEWKNLRETAFVTYLGPYESKTFPLHVPKQTQACRYRFYYEDGPMWSMIDGFLRDHNINLPLSVFTLGRRLNQKIPGHFQQLEIEVKIPPQQN